MIFREKTANLHKFGGFVIFAYMNNNQTYKGRNITLIQHRNQRLVARFYYYSHILGLKFSRCLERLSLEFDLTESRICDLISENTQNIADLENKKISPTELRRAYPFMNWDNLSSSQLNTARQLSSDLFGDFAL